MWRFVNIQSHTGDWQLFQLLGKKQHQPVGSGGGGFEYCLLPSFLTLDLDPALCNELLLLFWL